MGIGHLTWRKSSYSTSNGGGCVEVARFPAPAIAVRDSKDPEGPRLVFTMDDWRAFVAGLKAGQFDLSLSLGPAGRCPFRADLIGWLGRRFWPARAVLWPAQSRPALLP
jgi:hypothetical protein